MVIQDLGPQFNNGLTGDLGPECNNTHLAPERTQDPGPGDNNKDSGPRS